MQIRIALLSNAGGSGKTTLAVHLAYLMGMRGYRVALIDLDPQGSVSLFCGLGRQVASMTIAAALEESFAGEWPLFPVWETVTQNVQVCQGQMGLIKAANELVLHERGAYLLSDRLLDYPLPQEVVIMDCPATLEPLPLIAVSASTHLLIPIQVEPKSVEAASLLLEWSYHTFRRLRLKPEPEIMGVVPCQYDARIAIHRNLLEQLEPQLKGMGIRCFPPIRYSAEFKNASSVGLPIQLYRHLHQADKDFNPIVNELVRAVEG